MRDGEEALGRHVTVDELRPEIAAFACAMEARLRQCARSRVSPLIPPHDRIRHHERHACADLSYARMDAEDARGRRSLEHAVDAAIEALTIANIAGAFRE